MFHGFSASVTLPFFQNRKARSAALLRAENARLANEGVIAVRRADVIATLQDMEIWQRQIDEYNRVFGDNAYLTLLLQAYRGGQINVIDYLSEVNYFYKITGAYLDSQYQYNQALTSLNRYSLLISPAKSATVPHQRRFVAFIAYVGISNYRYTDISTFYFLAYLRSFE